MRKLLAVSVLVAAMAAACGGDGTANVTPSPAQLPAGFADFARLLDCAFAPVPIPRS